jgi:hypothetical protein
MKHQDIRDDIQDLVSSLMRKQFPSSIAMSFVNGSISPKTSNSPCSHFATYMETTKYGEPYRIMNQGYRRLSRIADHVQTDTEAFQFIEQAFGSVEFFFDALEKQRLALKAYAESLIAQGGKHWLHGVFLFAVSVQARGWGRKFRHEYTSINKSKGSLVP